MGPQPTNVSNGSTDTTSSETGGTPAGPGTLVGGGGAVDTLARRADRVSGLFSRKLRRLW